VDHKENHIFIYNEIGTFGNSPDEIQSEINKIPDADELIIHISSPGGDVFAGWTIGNILKGSDKKITVIIEGLCASIATYIALQADEVQMAETARFMIHNPAIMLQGDASDLKAAAEQLESIKTDLVNLYKTKTKLSNKKISEMMDEETWLTPKEAKELGFIDSIITGAKAVAKLETKNIHKMKDTKDTKDKELNMESISKKFLDGLDNIVKNIQKITGAEHGMILDLEDGSQIFIDSDDGELEGKAAFTVDEEGNQTETKAPEGTHLLADGRSITINVDGIIESVQEADAEQKDKAAEVTAALNKEVDELKAKLEDKKINEKKLADEMEVMKTNTASVITEINNLKKMTVGGPPIIAKGNIKPINKANQAQIAKEIGLSGWVKDFMKL